MKIVSVSQTQTFKFIPRIDYPFTNLDLNYKIVDEQTGKSETIQRETGVSTDKNFMGTSMTFTGNVAPFREGHFYTLEITKTDGTLAYRDKLFCTNQATEQSKYDVNKDVYETNDTHDNDYIVL